MVFCSILSGSKVLFAYFVWVSVSHSVVSDSLGFRGLQPARLLCPWNLPGEKTGVGSHSLLQGIFLTQGSKPGLLLCRQILYPLSHQGSHLNSNEQSPFFDPGWPELGSSVLLVSSCEGWVLCSQCSLTFGSCKYSWYGAFPALSSVSSSSFFFFVCFSHQKTIYFYFLKMYFFKKGIFVTAHRLSAVVASRGLLCSCSVWASDRTGSRAWALSLQHRGPLAPCHVESSLTRDRTCVPCIDRQILKHQTTREVPQARSAIGVKPVYCMAGQIRLFQEKMPSRYGLATLPSASPIASPPGSKSAIPRVFICSSIYDRCYRAQSLA